MPACPNCGRQTQRTKDWACQWCGYPLISRAFKKIDKTYKELQEERNLSPRYEEAEIDDVPEPEVEAETQPEPEPPPEPQRHRFFHREPKPQPVPEPETPPPAPQPVMRRETKPVRPQPVPKVEPRPQPPPQPVPSPEPQNKLEPKVEPAPAPQPVPQLPPRPVSQPEPEPAPMPVIPLDSIKEGMEIYVDQLNALFKAEKSNANARFKDKVIIVKGIVEKIFIREHLEIRYIVLAGSRKNELWSVRCSFEKEGATGLNRLNEGQEAAIRGKYDGYGKNIIFKNCSLV